MKGVYKRVISGKLIAIAFLILIISCQQEDHKLDLTNKRKLERQLKEFISEINLKSKTSKYRGPNVEWWNVYNDESISGKAKIIPDNISLSCLKPLVDLKIDSLCIIGDTISGLIHEEFYKCILLDTSYMCTAKHKADLIVDKSGVIKGIVNREIHTVCCFYIDQNEISSNEYKQWIPPTQSELDTIEIHKNDYELIDACN